MRSVPYSLSLNTHADETLIYSRVECWGSIRPVLSTDSRIRLGLAHEVHDHEPTTYLITSP